MRLPITFLVLLLLGSTGMTVAWEQMTTARDGQLEARVIVFLGGGVAFLSVTLLGRIVYQISNLHGSKKGS